MSGSAPSGPVAANSPTPVLSRREALARGTAGVAALFALCSDPRFAFPGQADQEELVPFQGLPRSRPNILDWETLDAWLTPQDQVFSVSHYGVPEIDPAKYKLEIGGLVEKPLTLTLADLQQRAADKQLMTLECSGNGASKGFLGAVYNSEWTGTRLAPLLKECGPKADAVEVVFFGADQQNETLRKGTPRELTFEAPFGRSLTVAQAMEDRMLLAWARNGKPLEARNGAPVRLIVPGWYGVANVKWLTRIELRSSRYMGRFMGRDYVTVRGERQGDRVVHVESSVTRMNLKSVVARVTRTAAKDGGIPCKAYGAAWSDGTDIKSVEVQVDGGAWKPAKLDAEPRAKYSWIFFSIDLGPLPPGKHTVVSRAIDANGRIQPAATDDEIALKKTYWEAYEQLPREIELKA